MCTQTRSFIQLPVLHQLQGCHLQEVLVLGKTLRHGRVQRSLCQGLTATAATLLGGLSMQQQQQQQQQQQDQGVVGRALLLHLGMCIALTTMQMIMQGIWDCSNSSSSLPLSSSSGSSSAEGTCRGKGKLQRILVASTTARLGATGDPAATRQQQLVQRTCMHRSLERASLRRDGSLASRCKMQQQDVAEAPAGEAAAGSSMRRQL
jgi:hypothetical protein